MEIQVLGQTNKHLRQLQLLEVEQWQILGPPLESAHYKPENDEGGAWNWATRFKRK